MNILILGTGEIEQTLIKICQKSKLLDKIYTASSEPLDYVANIEYENFDDLSLKSRGLQIDIVVVADKKLIKDGIVEFLKTRFINVIAVNKKWLNLETSRLATKQLLQYYKINIPKTVKAPVEFPLVIKSNITEKKSVVSTMSELVAKTEETAGEPTFLEEYMTGEIIYLLSLWDGQYLASFEPEYKFTEVQEDRLELYKTKLNFMLSDEKADFTGFFITKLIWAKNDWYVLDYKMRLSQEFDLGTLKQDFLYVLNSAIYQKLNEL